MRPELRCCKSSALTARHRQEVPDWMTNADGMIWQSKVWDSIAEKLESVQPGCIEAALGDEV